MISHKSGIWRGVQRKYHLARENMRQVQVLKLLVK